MPRASRDFQVFAKPAGAVCNLDCHYCYYLKKRDLYPDAESFRMADDLLETYIVQHIAASPGPVVNFSWHGGEPTVLGLDYFGKIVALQQQHRLPGQRITNGIQTNGVLLDAQWCRFLAAEGFGVGLSVDGPPELHDRYRVTKGQEPTHKQTMRGFELLQRHGIECDMLCVVHDQNVQHPLDVYRFFRNIGAKYLSFLPVVHPMTGVDSGVSRHTVPAESYGTFLCTVFDEWMRKDIGRVMVQIFEEASRSVLGLEHRLCIYRPTCGDIPVIEHNGDFYSCDHFVDSEHCLGNVRETPLVELLESPAQIAFGRAKRDSLPGYCRECGVLDMCNGGCPKDRFILTPDGEPGLNYLCEGLKSFFTYSRQHLLRLASPPQDRQETGPALPPMPRADAHAFLGAGRNEPCPCGSGRKYKKCCLSK